MSHEKRHVEGRRSADAVRTGFSEEAIRRDFLDNLFYLQGRFRDVATKNDFYLALAYTVRDRLLQRWVSTSKTYFEKGVRTVSYLSAEFLPGPHLGNNILNLGIMAKVKNVVEGLGLDLDELLNQEEEPGLGNGGLGRLAACYLDSLATLEIPAIGYGIRYEFGIFDQEIRDGWQVEVTDKWLQLGNPWEIPRPEIAFYVKFGGSTSTAVDGGGRHRVKWNPDHVVKGVAYDTAILGYRVNTANLLRLWKAEACESFDFQAFNVGDYYGAVEEKMVSENLTKVLYPNDEPLQGKELRLKQQYFFTSCALQDMLRIYRQQRGDAFESFHEMYAVQLNDTHPAIGVAELMRLLVDEHSLGWEKAWEVTQKTFSYTNHTLLSEALEKWPLEFFGSILPRHLEIIYEINRRFLDEVRLRWPGDESRVSRLSIIEEGGGKQIRMAHLACAGSHTVNGVAELHTSLVKGKVLRDLYEFMPEKFVNVTNGVTPRRFMALTNPRLAELISSAIGDGWVRDLDELQGLEEKIGDDGFLEAWRRVKALNKADLARFVRMKTGVGIDPETLFDIHVKRIHEYKRQHLNVLHIVALYNRLRRDGAEGMTPRTFLFGGKAAPSYFMAKLIVRLIHGVAERINGDPDVNGLIKVVFLPDFNVKNARHVYSAADLSEQISLAGKEASGTGNMKFSLNGALTIGTLDGANIEIREAVGSENFFQFGMTAEEVSRLRERGYTPRNRYRDDDEIRAALDLIASGHFSPGEKDLFRPIVDNLLYDDDYMVLADFPSYLDCQDVAGRAYGDQDEWTRMAILNVARMGRFSSDRSIKEYCRTIWKVEPVPIELWEGPP